MTDLPFEWMMSIDDRVLHALTREGGVRLDTLQEELERYDNGTLKRDGFLLFRCFTLEKHGFVECDLGRFSLTEKGRRYLEGDLPRATGRNESATHVLETRSGNE